MSEKLQFNLNPLIMCQQVIRTVERDFTFGICLHIYYTFFLSPCFCWEWQRDRQCHSGVFWKESFIVIKLVTQKLLWSSLSFIWSGCSAVSRLPCSTEFCGEEHAAFCALSILPLWLPAVCLRGSVVCRRVCRTDCTPTHCSQWPPRPYAALCICIVSAFRGGKENRQTWH